MRNFAPIGCGRAGILYPSTVFKSSMRRYTTNLAVSFQMMGLLLPASIDFFCEHSLGHCGKFVPVNCYILLVSVPLLVSLAIPVLKYHTVLCMGCQQPTLLHLCNYLICNRWKNMFLNIIFIFPYTGLFTS